MRRKIIYLVNPVSGTSSKDSVQNTIAAETLKSGIPFRFFPSVANGDYSFLEETILTEKITDIVIVGGDGTVSQVVDSLMAMPVQFGIVPCGSGNGLAFGAGIPKTIKKALAIIFNNHSQQVDGFRINKRFACMLCGIGFDGQVAHDFAKANQRGLATYVKKVFSNFFTALPYSFKIKLNNKIFTTEAYFISIANSNQFGNNFTIAPKASLNDGKVDVVIVTDQSKLTLLYNTFMQVGGLNGLQKKENINENKSVIYFQTSEIRISNYGEAPMHIDGEPVETEKKIHIEVQPSCFKLLTSKDGL
ncbi:diacylglycerol/lipid kinase family protein [Niabella hibiscisoli]|uniref:diacylglycerol/lipid kinase family protein n=1 Tax=Niabella hibiscisoli TaxID=1825928 RepID=UPI001F0DD12F|nr:YegS/Rv2252/BmrU family lipid kinase [Niabella hibiscisoli]MCH5716346.1 YegS/Rv2252/BmrU family lipid kinase [Niabella hibiscisoli]